MENITLFNCYKAIQLKVLSYVWLHYMYDVWLIQIWELQLVIIWPKQFTKLKRTHLCALYQMYICIFKNMSTKVNKWNIYLRKVWLGMWMSEENEQLQLQWNWKVKISLIHWLPKQKIASQQLQWKRHRHAHPATQLHRKLIIESGNFATRCTAV